MKKNFDCTVCSLLAVLLLFCMFPASALADNGPILPSEPEVTPTPVPSSAPTPTPKPKNTTPVITKHPTGETVTVGGRATFIARADDAVAIIWRLVSADTTSTYECKVAPDYFKGLKVEGLGTEKLVLSNIPKSLDGWSVEAKFIGSEGNAFSNGAILRVKEDVKKLPPTISTQPSGISTQIGSEYTLSVSVSDPNNGTLSYQWYSSQTDSTAGGAAISGATSSSFTPPQNEGTVYYYVVVESMKNGDSFGKVTSKTAAVTYTPQPEATPVPTPAPTPVASTMPPQGGTAETTPTPVDGRDPSESEGSGTITLLVILMAASGLAVVIIIVVLIISMKKGRDDENATVAEEDTYENISFLPTCKKCGWQAVDPSRVPNFCPVCGTKFPGNK